MTKPKHLNNQEIDIDAQLRAMHDDDCDLVIFIGGRIADEAVNGPRYERLTKLLNRQLGGKRQWP